MEKLTEGSIWKVLAKLALPIMASSFLSTAYSITDMAWIGTLGSRAVAGIGVGGMYVWLSQGLASLARMGGQVYVGQALGRGERDKAKKYALAAVWLVILFGILFGAISLIFTNPMVGFFGLEDPETLKYAVSYMRIACGMIVFSYVGFVLTGLYTAQGDSKTPLKANFIGLAVNMLLDPLLILGIGPFPRLEVTGAAIATVIAQVIVTLVLIIGIVRSEREKNILKEVSWRKIPASEYVAAVIKMGGPTALQGTIYCMISMVLTRMVASFGDGAVATQRVGGQIESLSWNTADGFAAALNAFAAQNYGAGKMDRVKKGYFLSAAAIAAWGTLIGLTFLLFPEQISELFFYEPEVIKISMGYLMIIGIGEPLMCVEIVAVGAISGLGNTKICSIISIILTGLRIPLALFLSRMGMGLNGIWWALTVSSVCKGIVFHLTFHRECKKLS
ncbi:MAG: MATE family efflux transporter [Lachnospiraceae bacterium]